MTLAIDSDVAPSTLRVAIASTTEDLEPYRVAAGEVTRELGFEPLLAEAAATSDDGSVRQRARRVAEADLLLAIVGWRRGEMPDPERGGDGRRSWTGWEVRAALRRARPVVVLMAGDGWPMEVREDEPAARAWLLDFRGDLYSLATFFEPESGTVGLAGFRELVRSELARHVTGARRFESVAHGGELDPAGGAESEQEDDLRLRSWPAPEWPERPYPVLLPYAHPELLAGRGRELSELGRLLRLPVPVLGLYGASGAGKSSLLVGGLVPALRAAGQPTAVVRHPAEPGLAGRLIDDLVEVAGVGASDPDTVGRRTFIGRLRAVRALAGSPPVLVVDQFEDLLSRGAGALAGRKARAAIGVLLAASVQRQPGYDGVLCRWLLAYRQEFHGEVVRWLGDVLREARGLGQAGAGSLPHDLSGPERFHSWPLRPLGAPPEGAADAVGEAARVFRSAIETPLAVRCEDGSARYPWKFAEGGAERLARAFGETRVAQPQAPLVPELQVVLAHLLERAVSSPDGGVARVEVPEAPGELIAEALEKHLRRALDSAFPIDRRAGSGGAARRARTRALLALRELADAGGRRGNGLASAELARAIGHEGREVLERLATPQTRVVVAEKVGDEWVYMLPHDRLASVLVRLVDEEGGRAELGIDRELLDLRRVVALKSELFATGEAEQATALPPAYFRQIESHAAALLWGEERRRWWQACRARFRAERRRRAQRWAIAALVGVALAVGVWSWTDRRARRAALFEEVAVGEPAAAFAALDRLLLEGALAPGELRRAMLEREKPLDVLERGVGGVAVEDGREEAVLRVAELALPLVLEELPGGWTPGGRTPGGRTPGGRTPDGRTPGGRTPGGRTPDGQILHDPVRIASWVWALDVFAPPGERTRTLRDLALEPLRRRHPPPPVAARDAGWADIPAGTFRMGSGPGEGRDDADKLDERPAHEVTLSAFRMGTHEVTNAEFRRLYPQHAKGRDGRLPAVWITWYEAYTYAAWLGGRLPTEAETEYAMRAGCGFSYCRRDGSAASLDEVAWWLGNSVDPATGDPALRPVAQLEPNPWGLFDIYGNAWELCADWYAAYPAAAQVDPPGPADSSTQERSVRGGGILDPPEWVTASGRASFRIGNIGRDVGFRVVLPAPLAAGPGTPRR